VVLWFSILRFCGWYVCSFFCFRGGRFQMLPRQKWAVCNGAGQANILVHFLLLFLFFLLIFLPLLKFFLCCSRVSRGRTLLGDIIILFLLLLFLLLVSTCVFIIRPCGCLGAPQMLISLGISLRHLDFLNARLCISRNCIFQELFDFG
jgi:hypothetical protein